MESAKRHVWPRGYRVWVLRIAPVALAAAATANWVDGTTAVVLWVLVVGWLSWTCRPAITASSEGLKIRSTWKSVWIPRERVRTLGVDREETWIHEMLDLQVIVRGQEPVRVSWVSWFPMWPVRSASPGRRELSWSQQVVIDRITEALGPGCADDG